MPEKTYTTTEISRICDVYPATVINWIDTGKLRAYTTPGGHRRVSRADLLEFLKKFKVPIPDYLLGNQYSLLIVDDDAESIRLIERAFAKYSNLFTIRSTTNSVEALVEIGHNPPNLLILDIVMPQMDGLEICNRLNSMPQTKLMKIIAVTGRRVLNPKELKEHGIHAMFRKPFSLAELTETAAKLLDANLVSSS